MFMSHHARLSCMRIGFTRLDMCQMLAKPHILCLNMSEKIGNFDKIYCNFLDSKKTQYFGSQRKKHVILVLKEKNRFNEKKTEKN